MNTLLKKNPALFKATSKDIIAQKVITFYEKMKLVAEFLEDNDAPVELRIKPEEIYLECYIDKPAIARLMNITVQDNFAQFGVFLGLEDPSTHDPEERDAKSFGRITTCFLGLDDEQNILGCHFPHSGTGQTATTATVDGEDTWPPPPDDLAPAGTVAKLPFKEDKAFTLKSHETKIMEYFSRPVTKPKE